MANSKSASGTAGASVPGILDVLADVPRQQAAVLNESLCALFQGFERLREIQGQVAHQAWLRHHNAVDRLAAGCGSAELRTLQSGLLAQDLRACAGYWQQLGQITMEMNQRLFTCLCQWGGPAAVEGVRQVTDAASVMSGLGVPFGWHPPAAQPRHR